MNVSRVVDDLMVRLYNKSYNDFVLLIARGQTIPGLEKVSPSRSNYSLDYTLDEHYDETREQFYVEYQPWITLVYLAMFIAPVISYGILKLKDRKKTFAAIAA